MSNWGFFVFFFVLSVLTLYFIVPKPKHKEKSAALNRLLGFEKVRKEAEDAGWNLSQREFWMITLFAVGAAIIIAIITGNYLFIALGLGLAFALPRIIVVKIKRTRRLKLLFELPSNLRMFISKLIDFPNIQTAMEKALPDMEGASVMIFQQVDNQLRIGMKLEKVMKQMNTELRIRKVENFTGKLEMAQREGFHQQTLNSLKDTVKEIEKDIEQIKELDAKAKKKRREVILMIGMCWAMPLILSGLNNGNANIFLYTVSGQVFIVAFAAATLYAVAKLDDYLSLNTDEF